MPHYRIPAGIEPIYSNEQVLLSTREGGRVMVDRMVLRLWQAADQHDLSEILVDFRSSIANPLQIRAGLACLAEAGLIERAGYSRALPASTAAGDERISVVIVSYNSIAWLGGCLDSLQMQTCAPFEIIVVDNASQDASAGWIDKNRPDIELIRLEQTVSLAQAINTGIRSAHGDYLLLLNPDVQLASDALTQMVQVAQKYSKCAAIAAKLRLLRTPHFLNGLGNLVGPISWGTDIGLGHLDLGQFDHWDTLPSACFAATLIPAWAISAVGWLDEQFPLYYEDSEWCYRARLLSYTIRAAPAALVYHAFSASIPGENKESLTPAKLRRVEFGRLNFITKINGPGYFMRFLLNYCLEDLARFSLATLRGRWSITRAIIQGWQDYFHMIPELKRRRQDIQAHRRLSDRALYQQQRQAPPPFIRRGSPQLTWDIICSHYARLIYAGQTVELPELEGLEPGDYASARILTRQPLLERTGYIWRNEGLGALLHRLGKGVQWRIMQM
jgi:GT2 family glycosyltransferase